MYKQILLELLNDENYKPMKFQDILATDIELLNNSAQVYTFLKELEQKQIIYYLKDKTYILANNICIGCFKQVSPFCGFVQNKNTYYENLYIYHKYYNGAISGDFVIAKEFYNNANYNNNNKEGKIIEIIKESNTLFVGKIKKHQNFAFVTLFDDIHEDIYINTKNIPEFVKDNDFVQVKIIKRNTNNKKHEGKIIKVISSTEKINKDIELILNEKKISIAFPEEVMAEIKSIPKKIKKSEIQKELKHRKDLRNLKTITIDSDDTKDFDDAISIKQKSNGNYILGVHIADVNHYVKENSAIDKEALRRGTSIYLPNMVVPMLPKELSNGICSLKPRTNRFAISCIMEINQKGNVVKSEIYESIIKVTKKMTYTDVQKILDEDKTTKSKYKDVIGEINKCYQLSSILRNKRLKRGYIDFGSHDTRIKLNKNNIPIEINSNTKLASSLIIEEFMIVCNETIADFFYKNNIPFIYRIHEKPTREKIENSLELFSNIGIQLTYKDFINSCNLNKILQKYKDSSKYNQVCDIILRSYNKAKYSNRPKEHFGLANKHYCHFTSPIRRYPDLQLHKIIKKYLRKQITQTEIRNLNNKLPFIAELSTIKEIDASYCETKIENYFKCLYLKNKKNTTYNGIVSGVTENGIYVKVENIIEGIIFRECLNTDVEVFFYDDFSNSYISNKQNVYTIGTKITVNIREINLSKCKISFDVIK